MRLHAVSLACSKGDLNETQLLLLLFTFSFCLFCSPLGLSAASFLVVKKKYRRQKRYCRCCIALEVPKAVSSKP